MRLTKKQKCFLFHLLNRDYMPLACDGWLSDYFEPKESGIDKRECWQEFKKHYGITIPTALKWWNRFINELEKDIKRRRK